MQEKRKCGEWQMNKNKENKISRENKIKKLENRGKYT